MQSNRESARRSRLKKQKRLEDLGNEVNRLRVMNSRIVESINDKERARIEIESMNNVLRLEAVEMTYRLRALNLVVQIVDDANVYDVLDPLLEPWQFDLPLQPSSVDYDTFLV